MIEIRHLKTLQAIRETGSLVEAAERVHLTQSALSHQIKELENRLDQAVIVRKSRPLRFTGAGKRLLHLADDILPRIKTTERDLKKMAGGHVGRLHIAIECHSCFQWLMPTIDAYRENWPEVELDFSTGFNFDPLPALQKGQLDLVITSDPTPLPGVRFEPLFRYEALLALSKQHHLVDKNPIEPQDLSFETLIAYPVDKERLDVYRDFLIPANVEPKEIRHAELTLMMMQLVASGRGVCVLPNWALAEYTAQEFVKVKSLGKGVWSTLYAALREEQAEFPYVRDFLNCALEKCFATLRGIKVVNND
mgnify:CR=1 FL=1